ncbi:phosphonate ABC transporter ATP-binding protein [Halorubrum sp. BOL3-1]|uniref:phosphonate ABC transporter ATP-binding protein n=1 Tax=Halorubrum sp. BOL3-1 TaxID=2497325 RepID=UPI00100519F6|nr:phosphonate ABC transporter ATP-binding protein [Halorubrum sp. BOL3-1]QAU13043.1 phosphonate ABC transporter ATP-binding protein [Halorubrum sp. BOL3-1]
MSKITIDGLTKRFGDTVALEDVSFEVPEGEFVIIMGVSGSGKSTLLRCIGGLLEPTEGSVRIDGRPVTSDDGDVAFIFQQHNLIEEMTAYSNALSGSLGRNGLPTSLLQLQSEDEKLRSLEALDTVGLLGEARSEVRQMSGGQQQRVGIARALVQEPGVMLADEPVSSLDPGSAQEVMRYLKQTTEDRGLTTLTSLHQVNIARKFGTRFIGLHEGRKVFDGYRDELTIDAIDDIYGDIDTEGMFVSDERRDEGDVVESTEEEAAP